MPCTSKENVIQIHDACEPTINLNLSLTPSSPPLLILCGTTKKMKSTSTSWSSIHSRVSELDKLHRKSVKLDHSYCLPDKLTLKRKLDIADSRHETQLKKCKLLSQSVRRSTQQVQKLKATLQHLEEKCLINCDLKTLLANRFEGLKLSLLTNEEDNADSKNKCYSSDVMEFSHTLYFLAPSAYKFTRKSLSLPHPSTLRRSTWMD